MNLSENLKKIRKDNNLSQEDLAEKLGVSRQSVSKWESGLAYPEMDKVLELCKLFNLNIDDLLNQDIKEIEKTKQSTSTINKYIDSFLSYISKTVNLFSSLKFKDKIKCIFEQCLIGFVLVMIALILHEVLDSVIRNIFNFLPEQIYYSVIHVFDAVYLLFAVFLVAVIILHIFKVRYLDYYVVVDKEEKNETEEVKEEKEETEVKEESVKKLNRKEEKIIIRDPKHSGYKFINGLVKVILFFIKCFVIFIGIGFACSLIALVACLVLSFLISHSGLLFVGILLGIIGCIIINLIILDIIINFLINRKNKNMLLIISFLVSLIMIGCAIGFGMMSFKDFNVIDVIDEYNDKYFVREEKHYKMNKNLSIDPYWDVEYIESKNDDVLVVFEHANYCEAVPLGDNNTIGFYQDCLTNPDLFKNFLSNLNDKVIVDDLFNTKVYANKNNIKVLKENHEKKIREDKLREEQEQKRLELEEKLMREQEAREQEELRRQSELDNYYEE